MGANQQDASTAFLLACLPYGKQERPVRYAPSVRNNSYRPPYTLNFPTSAASSSMLSLFFRVKSFTSCTALLICCTPALISCRLLGRTEKLYFTDLKRSTVRLLFLPEAKTGKTKTERKPARCPDHALLTSFVLAKLEAGGQALLS